MHFEVRLDPSPPSPKMSGMFLKLLQQYRALFWLFFPENLKNTIYYQSKKSKKLKKYPVFQGFKRLIIWEKHSTIGQKSQNSARLFSKKVNKVPCIISAIWGKILANLRKNWLFGNFWCKNTLDYRSKKSKIMLDIMGAFWGKAYAPPPKKKKKYVLTLKFRTSNYKI